MSKYSGYMLKNSVAGEATPPATPVAMAATVLVLCFAFNFVGRGVGDTYMVFLLPLEKEFGWHRSQMTGVYSALMVVSGLAAPLGGMVFERWGPRVLYAGGLALLGSGYFLASKVTALWQFYVCISLLGGLGMAAIGMVPAAALISRWFERRLSTAIGIAYAGFGCGSLLIVPLAQTLIDGDGWRHAYQVIGATLLALLPISLAVPWRTIRAGLPSLVVPRPARRCRRRAGARGAARPHLLAPRAGDVLHRRGHVPDHRPVGRLPRRRRLHGAAGRHRVRRCRRALGGRRVELGLARRPLRPPPRRNGELHRHLPRHLVAARDVVRREPRDARRLCAPVRHLPGCARSARRRPQRAPVLGPGAGDDLRRHLRLHVGRPASPHAAGALHDLTGGYRAGFVLSMVCVLLAALPF
jgi:hypothetical protein